MWLAAYQIRNAIILSVALHPAFLGPGATQAQESGRLEGIVLDDQTLQPVEGARVSVSGESDPLFTAQDGSFSFGLFPVGVVQLRVQLDGYSSALEQVEVVAEEGTFLQLSMTPIAATLAELIARSGRRRADLDAVEAGDSDSSRTVAELLSQRLPGVTVDRGSGVLGGGVEVRIRGVGSISGAREPAIFLDGIRLNPSRPPDLSLRTTPGLQILDEIPASQVRSVRVLRGPSASAAYGESADGVILIETDRGQSEGPGPPERDRSFPGFAR